MTESTILKLQCLDGTALTIELVGCHRALAYELYTTGRKFVRAPNTIPREKGVDIFWEVTRWPEGRWRDKVIFTCERCRLMDATSWCDIRFDLCQDCLKEITVDVFTSKGQHCKFAAPYSWCSYTDLNEAGFCKGHARVKCVICGEQATGGCETGTFAACGTPTCDRGKCWEKHSKKDHPDGRLA